MVMFTDAFRGRHITVLSGPTGSQERADTGTLVDMDGNWLQIAKDNGEMLLFPFTAVRVIKLLDVEPPYTVVKEDVAADPVLRSSSERLS